MLGVFDSVVIMSSFERSGPCRGVAAVMVRTTYVVRRTMIFRCTVVKPVE